MFSAIFTRNIGLWYIINFRILFDSMLNFLNVYKKQVNFSFFNEQKKYEYLSIFLQIIP